MMEKNNITVSSVGYIDEGRYSTRKNGKPARVYSVWRRMISRCYSKSTQKRQPSYVGCYVDKEWHSFQNFAEWFYRQPNSMEAGFELDKDLILSGNKVYGPSTCSFVPREVNRALVHRGNPVYDLPRGVTMFKGKYRASVFENRKYRFLGDFDSLRDACIAYSEAKEMLVKNLANKFIGDIDVRVYKFLMEWEAH